MPLAFHVSSRQESALQRLEHALLLPLLLLLLAMHQGKATHTYACRVPSRQEYALQRLAHSLLLLLLNAMPLTSPNSPTLVG
jgi:hypothetical protein